MISQKTVDILAKETNVRVCIYSEYNRTYPPYDYVVKRHDGSFELATFANAPKLTIICSDCPSFDIPNPKKELFVEDILDKIAKKVVADKDYVSFAKYFEALINKRIGSCRCYATTYGVGLFFFKIQTEIESIKSILNEIGVEFKNEVSEGGYVYRFVIRKKQSNIDIIKNLV